MEGGNGMKIKNKIAALALTGLLLGVGGTVALTPATAEPAQAFTRTSCIGHRTIIGPARYGSQPTPQSYCYIGNVTPWDYFVLGIREGWQWVNGTY
jgi:hypothetical protein